MSDTGRGAVVSDSSGEKWNFSGGSKLECVEGSYLVKYTWDGRLFKPEDDTVCHGAYGVWENDSWSFFIPAEDANKPFWVAKYDAVDKEAQLTSIMYKSVIAWNHIHPDTKNARWQKKDGGTELIALMIVNCNLRPLPLCTFAVPHSLLAL